MNDAEFADEAVAKLERKFRKIYKQAEKDIEKKMKDFVEENKVQEEQWEEKVKNGKATQKQFDEWKKSQLYVGESWEAQRKSIAYTLANSNDIANNLVNGESIDVFTYAENYTAYEFENGFGVNLSFDVYDKKTVMRLLKDDPDILPLKKLDKLKDVRWNMKNIRSQVLQGILQGESIDKIARRLATIIPNRNENQMKLHARTAITSAQNGGRMERYREAEDLGIKFKKVWLATHDGRARELHLDLDGQAVDPEEPFEIDGYEIMYPGDPWAEPEMVYNCRCTMVTELDKYPSEYKSSTYDKKMSFDEWVGRK